MTDKKKKLAKALQAKTGMSRQAAMNVLAASGSKAPAAVAPLVALPPAASPPIDLLLDLLQRLRPSHESSVGVGRLPSVGRSADPAVAEQHSRRLADVPVYFAETHRYSTVVPFDVMVALVQRGATPRGEVQFVRVAPPRTPMGRSVECAKCHRYFSTRTAGKGACKCGQPFVISHDGEDDGSVREATRCMDCGTSFEMARVEEGRSPWRVENDRQMACAMCSSMSHIGPKGGLRRLAL